MPSIKVNGVVIEYRLLRTRQNKHLRLTVSDKGGVRVSAPKRCPESRMHALVRERAEWIIDQLRAFEIEKNSKPRLEFRDGASIPIHGKDRRIHLHTWDTPNGRVRLEEDALLFTVPEHYQQREEVLRELFGLWLRRYARWYLPKRCFELAERMGDMPSRISIRRQRSKWGSCSARGSINLNMLLVLLPESTSDYVIIHELAHLRELNHSPAFWARVDLCCPDRRVEQRRLREESWLLDGWDGVDA